MKALKVCCKQNIYFNGKTCMMKKRTTQFMEATQDGFIKLLVNELQVLMNKG